MNNTLEVILTLIAGILGGGLLTYLIQRKDVKKEKRIDSKKETYESFMTFLDDMNKKIYNDPEFLNSMLDFSSIFEGGDLNNFNERLILMVKKSVEPLLMMNQEINKVLLVASDELKEKVEELKLLTDDFNTDMQNAIKGITQHNEDISQSMGAIVANEKWERFKPLQDEIIKIMRKELNYN